MLTTVVSCYPKLALMPCIRHCTRSPLEQGGEPVTTVKTQCRKRSRKSGRLELIDGSVSFVEKWLALSTSLFAAEVVKVEDEEVVVARKKLRSKRKFGINSDSNRLCLKM